MICVNHKDIIPTRRIHDRRVADVLDYAGTWLADPAVLVRDLRSFRNARFDQDPNLVRCQKADHLLADLTVDLIREGRDQRAAAGLCTLINIRKQHADVRGVV